MKIKTTKRWAIMGIDKKGATAFFHRDNFVSIFNTKSKALVEMNTIDKTNNPRVVQVAIAYKVFKGSK